jgi:serine/threonine-protein phosphatase 2A regulatory subunit A
VNERHTVLIPIAKMLVKDSSWWVRRNMAASLPQLVPHFTSDFLGSDIGAVILFLLRDLDPEVKAAASRSCAQIVDVLMKENGYFNDSVLADIIDMKTDRFPQVRETVASDLLVFARITGEGIAKEKIYPMLADLLSDPERDVVVAALKGLRENFDLIDSYAVTQAALPKIMEIAVKEDFRVKIEIIRLFSRFLPYISAEAMSSQVVPLISAWLQDSVYKVRREIAEKLTVIIRIVDNLEFRDEIFQVLMRLNYSPLSGVRQASLMVVWFLSEAMPKNVVSEKMLSSVMLMASDTVPNVRLLAAKVLLKLKNFVDGRGINQVERGLRLLVNDADPDVKYFASHPVASITI